MFKNSEALIAYVACEAQVMVPFRGLQSGSKTRDCHLISDGPSTRLPLSTTLMYTHVFCNLLQSGANVAICSLVVSVFSADFCINCS